MGLDGSVLSLVCGFTRQHLLWLAQKKSDIVDTKRDRKKSVAVKWNGNGVESSTQNEPVMHAEGKNGILNYWVHREHVSNSDGAFYLLSAA